MKVYETVLHQRNSANEDYFINLKTGDKVVIAEPRNRAKSISLLQEPITHKDIERAMSLFGNGELSIQHLSKLYQFFESQQEQNKKPERKLGKAEEVAIYTIKSAAYMEIINAINFAFMPEVDKITYFICCGSQTYENIWRRCM